MQFPEPHHSKKIARRVFGAIVAFIILLGLAYHWFGAELWPRYVAVYANTGDIYFGRVMQFPHFGLKNAWYLQKDASGSLSLSEFSKVIWEPRGDIYFNDDQVIWTAPLRQGTQVYAVVTGSVYAGEPIGETEAKELSELSETTNIEE